MREIIILFILLNCTFMYCFGKYNDEYILAENEFIGTSSPCSTKADAMEESEKDAYKRLARYLCTKVYDEYDFKLISNNGTVTKYEFKSSQLLSQNIIYGLKSKKINCSITEEGQFIAENQYIINMPDLYRLKMDVATKIKLETSKFNELAMKYEFSSTPLYKSIFLLKMKYMLQNCIISIPVYSISQINDLLKTYLTNISIKCNIKIPVSVNEKKAIKNHILSALSNKIEGITFSEDLTYYSLLVDFEYKKDRNNYKVFYTINLIDNNSNSEICKDSDFDTLQCNANSRLDEYIKDAYISNSLLKKINTFNDSLKKHINLKLIGTL